jgi:hypothetical protein
VKRHHEGKLETGQQDDIIQHLQVSDAQMRQRTRSIDATAGHPPR